MTAVLGQPFKAQFFDADGYPLVGGKVYLTEGYDETPVITYTDPTKTAVNPNPVILDERGEAGIWADITGYKIRVYSDAGALIYSSDSYPSAPPAKATFYDLAGEPLVGGKIYFYVAGTSTMQPTYTSAAQTTENSNPVILDSNGQADLWFGPNLYKILLKTSTDVEIYSVDNYGP